MGGVPILFTVPPTSPLHTDSSTTRISLHSSMSLVRSCDHQSLSLHLSPRTGRALPLAHRCTPACETGGWTLHEKKSWMSISLIKIIPGLSRSFINKTDTLVIFGLTIDLQSRLPCICENHQRLAPVSHPAVPGPHIGCNGNGNDRWHGQAVGTGGPRPAGGYLGQGPRDQKSGVHTEK